MTPTSARRSTAGTGWEAALVAQARAGDESAFEALVGTHQDRAYRVALRMTGSPQDAQDVVQEALLYAWKGLPRYRGDAGFATWLIRIVINRCHNLRRAERPTDPLPDDDAADAAAHTSGADTVVVAAQQREATMAALLLLTFEQRAALVLHTFGGYTHADVGRILGITESAAKVRVHRARRALTDRLQDWR